MREIPELQILCLRAVGSHSCSVEDTFAKLKNGELSRASRLLRRFHDRSSDVTHSNNKSQLSTSDNNDNNENDTDDSDDVPLSNEIGSYNRKNIPSDDESIRRIPLPRKPCIGHGSARRVNANEVDLNHPIIACRMPLSDDVGNSRPRKYMLVMQYGSTALDCLQSYIDALVELGRMDDTRLGIHYFEEWKANVLLQSTTGGTDVQADADFTKTDVLSKKRKRGSNRFQQQQLSPNKLGSLSLHNCTLGTETIDAMVKSGMGPYLAVLDLTGVHGVTDEISSKLFTPTVCSNLKRLSLKNCRKISRKSIQLLPTACARTLECLDIGGCFNISSMDVLDIIPSLPKLSSLHVSGLQWDDKTVSKLVRREETQGTKTNTGLAHWEALSLGFSMELTQFNLRENLLLIADTLQSLALPFCESVVDNTLLGMLGRNLPHIKYLDLRGNPSLNTVTGWYDGRVSADLSPTQELTVLARYTSITESSLEETRRVHPQAATLLVVVLDGGGMGTGIAREYM